MTDWQPIETAPKELLRCLLFCPEKVSKAKEDNGIVMGRFAYGEPYGDGMNGPWVFTRWMPLPEPPSGDPA
jgi:hypothetical protein